MPFSLACSPSTSTRRTAARARAGTRPAVPELGTVDLALAEVRVFLANAAGENAGVSPGRMDSLTPAVGLSWLPTLPSSVRRRWHGELALFAEHPHLLWVDGPPSLETQAAHVLARWRTGRRAKDLCGGALRLLAASVETGGRSELDPAQAAWVLHPILLAARLGGLRLDRPISLSSGRTPKRVLPLDIVKRQLDVLAAFLIEADLNRGTAACPTPEVILCLATELWRNTTPWSAALRTPLEVAAWERWRRLRDVEDLDALTLAALLIAAENLHLDVDLASLRWRLAALQESDGGFAAGALLAVLPGQRHIGSRTLTSVLAARALGGQPRTGGECFDSPTDTASRTP